MGLLTAMFDVILIPIAVAKDVMDTACGQGAPDGYKSETRKQLEKVERDLDE